MLNIQLSPEEPRVMFNVRCTYHMRAENEPENLPAAKNNIIRGCACDDPSIPILEQYSQYNRPHNKPTINIVISKPL